MKEKHPCIHVITVKEYNTYIRYLGYQIQVTKGIVYPTSTTLESINTMITELDITLNNFKITYPKEYIDSIPVSTYSKYLNK